MKFHLTIVHANDDVTEGDFATFGDAMAAAVSSENERHGRENQPLSSFFDVRHFYQRETFTQWGTDYHWILIEKVES